MQACEVSANKVVKPGRGALLLRCTHGGWSAERFPIGTGSPHDYSYQMSDQYK